MSVPENHDLVQPPPGRAAPLFVADALYLAMVYVAFLAIPPLGRDYAALANPEGILFFSSMVRLFGDLAPAYLLVNLVLLYGCMALILGLTRQITRGPWWLGSVAAVLFMANPVKTEAVLNSSGIRELLPGFMALLTLYVYIRFRRSADGKTGWLPFIVYVAAVLTGPINIMLAAVVIVLEYSVFKERSYRWKPIAVAGLIALYISGDLSEAMALHPANMFLPLFFVLYPIGMLPDTVAFFEAWPVLGYALGVLGCLGCVWLIRTLHNPAITFGIFGAVVFRLCQGGYPVDAVTLAGGGHLLVPAALLAIAVAGFFQVLLQDSRWRTSAVRVSTLLCVVAMGCQIWVNLHWRDAGREVQQFQAQTAEIALAHPDVPLAVVPDIQYYRTAPVMLAESVAHQTPFGAAYPVVSLLPVSVIPPMAVEVEHYSPDAVVVTVEGLAVPASEQPPLFSRCWWLRRYRPPEPVTLRMEAGERPFPAVRIDF